MWYRKIILAERGKINIPVAKRELGKMIELSIIKDVAGNSKIDINKLNDLVKKNFYLSSWINGAQLLPEGTGFNGQFDPEKKIILLKQIDNLKNVDEIITTLEHEFIHNFDPGLDTKLNRVNRFYPDLKSLKLSYEQNLKLQALWNYLDNFEWESPEAKSNYMEHLYWAPESAMSVFDNYMNTDRETLTSYLNQAEKQGVIFNNQYMNKQTYEAFQKKYINQVGKVSPLKYFDMTGEPTAWMADVDNQFSPGNFVKWFSKEKKFLSEKLNKNLTPEDFIKFVKGYLTHNNEFQNIEHLTSALSEFTSVDASSFIKNIKDPKILRQILDRIGSNLNKADLLLKGGLLKLSNLELRTLSPEFADYVKSYLKDLPVELQNKFYVTQDINGNFKGHFEGFQFIPNEYQDMATIANWDNHVSTNKVQTKLVLPFSDKIGNNFVEPEKTVELFKYCNNADCQKFHQVLDNKNPKAKFCKGCGKRLRFTTDVNTIKTPVSTPNKNQTVTNQTSPAEINQKKKTPESKPNAPQTVKNQIKSDEISKKTSSLPDAKKPSTPKSTSALSKILPTIKKLFTELNAILDKFNNNRAGKVFNYGMLAKDVYFVITLTNQISKQIENKEKIMLKDQLDLGLTIVSILTDQQFQAILKTLYPPIITLLENPQVKAWLIGLNIGANVLMGLVSVTDWIGSNIDNVTGEANPNTGTLSGILNVPGSAQALVMPVFHLFDKYGEVFNALVDVEKGKTVPEAINKHIIKDYSGGIEPYRSSLFYKFRKNKDKIIAYQKSPAFKKLPPENQVLYPNANSPYAVSSYKKARDAQERERQEAMARYRASRMPKE